MSQQYTEVEWQDPAGGNPGTLINKARLDQMQTAHHYADGFEEVDTAPTADPGVDYHKVVYCTADSTFYRWDGTQWQKDIDDDTKALLLAHEADHANPHQVTKAQVGLGNADNTSDADKPISTATQTALALKADNDKVVHNTGNEDVLGTKKFFSQILRSAGTLGEAFNYTVLGGTASGGEKMWELKGETRADGTAGVSINSRKSDGTYETIVLGDGQGSSSNKVVTAGEMSTALSAKADKSDTYTKAEVDTALAGKADTATTLAGYGITDAYTKTEADTLLGAKADTTALTDGSVTKVGTSNVGSDTKPIKLVAGVPTAVTDTLATQTYVSDALDGYLPMVRTTGNQDIAGIKTFTSGIIAYPQGWHSTAKTGQNQGQWAIFAKITPTSIGAYHYFEFIQNSNTANAYGLLLIHEAATSPNPIWISRAFRGTNNPLDYPNEVTVLSDGTNLYLAWNKGQTYGGVACRSYFSNNYTTPRTPDTNITWYADADRILLDNLNDYTVYDPIDSEVHTSGNETIAGTKTFTNDIVINKGSPVTILQDTVDVYNTAPTFNRFYGVAMLDKNGDEVGAVRGAHYTSGTKSTYLSVTSDDGTKASFNLLTSSNTPYMTGPSRAYNASNTTDVATIGTLDAYTPMVRTTGNQEISGTKTFLARPIISHQYPALLERLTAVDISNPVNAEVNPIIWLDKNNTVIGQMRFFVGDTGATALQYQLRNADGTWRYITVQ